MKSTSTCLPKDLPEFLEVDLGEPEVGDIVHLSDLKLPDGVDDPRAQSGQGTRRGGGDRQGRSRKKSKRHRPSRPRRSRARASCAQPRRGRPRPRTGQARRRSNREAAETRGPDLRVAAGTPAGAWSAGCALRSSSGWAIPVREYAGPGTTPGSGSSMPWPPTWRAIALEARFHAEVGQGCASAGADPSGC